MAEYGLNRNSEGYADPTAAEAIKGMAKPGEIWKYKGREVLIVKNQGGYSNILTLSTAPGKDKNTIEVAGRYTTPGKLNYAFNDRLGAMVGRITDGELKEVVAAIEDSLSIRTELPIEEKFDRLKESMECANVKTENRRLKKRLEVLRGMYDELLNRFLNKESEYV
jgi:hypothetical protein